MSWQTGSDQPGAHAILTALATESTENKVLAAFPDSPISRKTLLLKARAQSMASVFPVASTVVVAVWFGFP
ncbi:hypothetical protein TPL01_24000 [Sulfuriferula plumbiphila]|uniref:Uncharacterized protein n=1 Tax=Sulfuriferula plumbiphila TaxID=171865 RepID=A0A512L9Y4_9PROT|nr:hypothetical protein TPL01_24000 [Sulfuriferula plumbiphila]